MRARGHLVQCLGCQYLTIYQTQRASQPLVELILARTFVDLGEFPPAKGFGKSQSALSSDVEGKTVLLQAAHYVQLKKHTPDLATWVGFTIYSAVLVTKHPKRAQMLFMYSAIIAWLSKKFRWPSWIIYDQYFR